MTESTLSSAVQPSTAEQVRPVQGTGKPVKKRFLELDGRGTAENAEWHDGDDITDLLFYAVPAKGNTVADNETLATGSIDLTAGASGSVDTITVNGVDILGASVPFNTSLNQTATDVAAQITSYTSNPNYTAAAVGASITITATAGSGCGINDAVVAGTATTITLGNEVAMNGGIASKEGNYVIFTDDPLDDNAGDAILNQVESKTQNVLWHEVKLNEYVRFSMTKALKRGQFNGGKIRAKTVGGIAIDVVVGGS